MNLEEWNLELKYLSRINDYINNNIDMHPSIGVVLGSGWGDYLSMIKVDKVLSFSDIPHFPISTVNEHAGKIIFGTLGDVPVVLMQGRIHYYEGYSILDVVRPIRFLAMLGVSKLILTNAAGAINTKYRVGEVVAINDHISSFIPNPLRGINFEKFGERFPDMSEIYNKKMLNISHKVAQEIKFTLNDGVYLQAQGPSFESASEINMYRCCGADLVGMSTVCEAMVAVHSGMKVSAFSFVSNMACGIERNKLSMQEVISNATQYKNQISEFMLHFIKELERIEEIQ